MNPSAVHHSHRPHHTGNNRTQNASEIRAMVDHVIGAKFGLRFLDWLREMRANGGVDGVTRRLEEKRCGNGELPTT